MHLAFPTAFLVLVVQINATRHPIPPTPARPLTATCFFFLHLHGSIPNPRFSTPKKLWDFALPGSSARSRFALAGFAWAPAPGSPAPRCPGPSPPSPPRPWPAAPGSMEPRRAPAGSFGPWRNPAEAKKRKQTTEKPGGRAGKGMLAVETRTKQVQGDAQVAFWGQKGLLRTPELTLKQLRWGAL